VDSAGGKARGLSARAPERSGHPQCEAPARHAQRVVTVSACEDCSAIITCVEVTPARGNKFISQHDSLELAGLAYRPEDGYTLRLVTGRRCDNSENHYA